MIYNKGDKVRINTPDEADHGAVVEAIGMHTSIFEPNGDQHVWVMMPFNFAWLYRVDEVEPYDEEPAEPEQEKEWWEGVDTSSMHYLEYGAYVDAMTPEEYNRYHNEGE